MEKLKLKKLLFCADVLVNLLTICAALDTIIVNQTIRDGETIVSAGYVFELGFFSRNGSTNRYLGIWYKEPPGSYVWVPNAGKPINDTSGVLKLSSDGRLLLLSGNDTIWASWFASSNTINPVAQLLDTGNLVVRDAVDQENIIWQSNPPYDCVRSGTCNRSPTRMMIEVPPTYETDTETKKVIKVVLPASFTFFVVLLILIYMEKEEPTQHTATKGRPAQTLEEDYTNESQREPAALPSFSLSKITNATNNFSIYNKLGQGGFGPVYKGVLEGQEIAVKRMSKTSSQGFNEFKNEVRCIAKLQHRNLVKLLGYCIQRDEFLLIYEYMPNKSLDSFIFDEVKSLMLGWPSRFRIIHGIARGLLYLHQDSRLRIIHRDLKAGNILLDQDMNPKISDFGLARRFRGQENEANTNKVVGTLGYISPEYAANGQFSIKSDVFSFGVLLLEIVSGKKNRGFTHQDHSDNLLGHAWRLYKSGKSLELLSATLCNSCVNFEVLRTIHIGLLCVQDHAEDRPTMLSVVSMLGSEGPLPPPKQPAFFTEKTTVELNPIPSLVSPPSIDCATITILDAR